jgi:RHS repeat-associated protein
MTDVVTEKNYTYTLDANKNVSDLTDVQGNVVAHYEYSPFGTHVATGSYTGNPFRFSSEVFDSETGLIYYNYRYYNPNLGRWINRDPIEEQGGWNLYVMIGNNVNNKMDNCGLLGFPSWDPRTWNSFHWYGNWGGPGWAAGGWVEDGWSNETPGKKNEKATDALDECYKNHDICYEKCRDDLICESDIKRCFSDCDYASLLCQLRATFNLKNNVAWYNRWQGVAGTIALGGQGVTRDAVNVTVTAAGEAKDFTVNIAIKTASTVKNTAVATDITARNTAVATAITVKNTAVATATTVNNVAIEGFDRAKNAWNWATTW